MEATFRLIENNNTITFLLVASFLVLSIAKQTYPRRFLDFLALPLSGKFLKTHAKEDELQHPFNLLFFLFQVINVTILIFLLVTHILQYEFNPWIILQIATLYCVFVLGKVLVEKILGNIFSIDSIVENYLYVKLSYRNYLSIIIFIGNIVLAYTISPSVLLLKIFVGLIILANLMLLLSLFRRNWNMITYNFFYFILYLCALEISPYIILYYLFLK